MCRPFACRLLSVASLLLIGAAIGRADPLAVKVPAEGEDKPDPVHIEHLITQLGADDFFDREAASEELTDLGEPVLETLRNVADTTEDLEIQHRTLVLVNRIELQLGLVRGPASCDELAGRLADSKYAHYRAWAAGQLGLVTDASRPQAVEALLKAAKQDAEANVRATCVRSLGKMNLATDEVHEVLEKLSSNDTDTRVREEAKKALKALSEQLPPPSPVGTALNGNGFFR